jgi:hypothetical protein
MRISAQATCKPSPLAPGSHSPRRQLGTGGPTLAPRIAHSPHGPSFRAKSAQRVFCAPCASPGRGIPLASCAASRLWSHGGFAASPASRRSSASGAPQVSPAREGWETSRQNRERRRCGTPFTQMLSLPLAPRAFRRSGGICFSLLSARRLPRPANSQFLVVH